MLFTDTHCHLDFIEFDSHREQLLKQCIASNIHQIIIPGITAKSWPRVLNLCLNKNNLHPCLGLHPWWIDKATPNDLELLASHLESNTLLALGEIGIDGKIDDINKQVEYFDKQLDLAKQFHHPVLIHHRNSHHLIQPILKQKALPKAGVIHAFSGNYQQAKAYLDLGFKLGIGGTITYDRAKKTIDAIKKLPIDSLVLETDAPAMPIAGQQGKANSPLMLLEIFNYLCEIRSEDSNTLAEQIEINVKRLFFS